MLTSNHSSGAWEQSLSLVRQFWQRYPPKGASSPPSESGEDNLVECSPELQAPGEYPNRASLEGAHPLVRVIPSATIPDTASPPFLAFHDLEALHHRLVHLSDTGTQLERKRATSGLKFLKWLCLSYESGIRKTRKESLKPKGVTTETPVPRVTATREDID